MSYVPQRNIPVVVQSRDALEAIAGLSPATGTITLAANPAAGDYVTIYDTTYEFNVNAEAVGAGNTLVLIGDDAEDSATNLVSALEAVEGENEDIAMFVVALAENGGAQVITLTTLQAGSAMNDEILKSGDNISVSGLSGGADGGTLNVTGAVTVSGLTFDKDIDIGDIHLLNMAEDKINPATEDGALADIKSNTDNIPALGQAIADNSVPVVLPEAQIITLTPPAAITNFAEETGGNLDDIASDLDGMADDLEDVAGILSGGLPVYGTDAAGADAYATVLTAPARVTRHAMVELDAGNDAIISFDAGTTDHLLVRGGNSYVFDGLSIASEATIQAKNASAGNNYANLTITVW